MRSKSRWLNLLVQMTVGFGSTYYAYRQLFIGNESGFLDARADQVALSIGCMGLLSLLFLLGYKTVSVDNASIEEKRLLGFGSKKLDRRHIKEYAELKIQGEFIVTRILILFADKELLRVSSLDIRNYDDLKSELIRDLEQRNGYEEKLSRYINRFGAGLLIMILLGLFLSILNTG